MLHARRKRFEAVLAAEVAGRSLWTNVVSDQVRTRLWWAVIDSCYETVRVVSLARRLVMRDEGLEYLSAPELMPSDDFKDYWLTCLDDMMPTLLEAVHEGIERSNLESNHLTADLEMYVRSVNEILNEHRIRYEMVNGQIVEFESKEMHEAVVEATLQLLAGRPEFSLVEGVYQKALKEISGGDPTDSITDSATALQEMFAALGCPGRTLSVQADAARKKGLLTGYDVKIIDWIAADRSSKGDAHNAMPARREDAWLTVHVVGALILRLAEQTSR